MENEGSDGSVHFFEYCSRTNKYL